MATVSISEEQHAALTAAAKENGYTIGKLLSIVIDVSILGIPQIIRKWRNLQHTQTPTKNENEQ